MYLFLCLILIKFMTDWSTKMRELVANGGHSARIRVEK